MLIDLDLSCIVHDKKRVVFIFMWWYFLEPRLMNRFRHGIPTHPAYIPSRQAGLTDRMNFLQRLKNVYMYGVHKLANHLQVQYFFAHLQQKYNLSPELYMSEMLARAELQIFIGDFELEFARPLQPNTIMVVMPLLFQDLHTSPEQEVSQNTMEFSHE